MARLFLIAAICLACAACSTTPPSCTTGSCACQGASDCPSGQVCIAGFCAAAQACQGAADCGPGDGCAGGVCVPAAVDAGRPPDAGRTDAGTRDAGSEDAGREDAGPDGGEPDAGAPDAGSAIPDGGADAGADGGTASQPDAGPDAGVDAGNAGCTSNAGCSGGLACKAGSCESCTADADCAPQVCCLGGTLGGVSCIAGSCVSPPGGCTSDSQCNPPAQVCVSGACVAGCVPGGCPTGQRCDDGLTGHCQPAFGSGAVGAPCQSYSDCATTNADATSGFCLSLLAPDGGTDSFCSSLCEATSAGLGCPTGFACGSFGGGSACIPESYLGGAQYFGDAGIGAACTVGSSTCDSVIGCGYFGTSATAAVCSDSCYGPSSSDLVASVCPYNWECDTELFFTPTEPDAGGVPIACTSDSACTRVSTDALCFAAANRGDGYCHVVFREDVCLQSYSGEPTLITGQSCSGSTQELADAQCRHNLCVSGKCADPCCSSPDCGPGYACEEVVEQSYSVLMACVPSTGTGAVGHACTPGGSGACRAQVSPSDAVDLCVPDNPYASSTNGYCTDTCCDDGECPSGYYCGLAATGLTDGQGNPLLSDVCLKL